MRIIGGTFGGRRFNPPARIPARPTTDLAREGLMNMLNNTLSLEGIKTLDLFGGTGSISYEFASHGAADLTIVESDATSAGFIRKTAETLGISDRFRVVRADVFKFLKQCTEQYPLIFADPPYALPYIDELPMLIFEKEILAAGGIFVMEHSVRNDYRNHPRFMRMKNYGTTVLTFFVQPND